MSETAIGVPEELPGERNAMNRVVGWSMRRAPIVLLLVSMIILVFGVAAAFMTFGLTSEQASHMPMSSAATQTYGVARIQLLTGLMAALQNASWPFAAGALIHVFRTFPALVNHVRSGAPG